MAALRLAVAALAVLLLPVAALAQQTDLESRVKQLEAQNAQLLTLVQDLQARLSAVEAGKAAAPPTGETAEPSIEDLLNAPPATAQGVGATGDIGGTPDTNPLMAFTFDFMANAGDKQPAPYALTEDLQHRLFGLRALELNAKRGVSAYGDAVVTLDFAHGAELEEGYIDVNRAVPQLNLRLGRWRVPFGPYNGVHQHQLPSADYPRSLANFFGEEGITGDGAEVMYLPRLPSANDYLELRAGGYGRLGEEAEEAGNPLSYSARVRYNHQLDPQNDLDLTTSYVDRPGEDDRALALGLQWRKDRGNQHTHRVILDFTNYWRDTPEGSLSRNGWGVCYLKQMGLYQDVGAQYEDAAFGDPGVAGRVRSTSAWFTYKAQETQWFRLQYRHSDYPAGPNGDEVMFQSIWTIGTHSHEFN
jgi:hypothetical protein